MAIFLWELLVFISGSTCSTTSWHAREWLPMGAVLQCKLFVDAREQGEFRFCFDVFVSAPGTACLLAGLPESINQTFFYLSKFEASPSPSSTACYDWGGPTTTAQSHVRHWEAASIICAGTELTNLMKSLLRIRNDRRGNKMEWISTRLQILDIKPPNIIELQVLNMKFSIASTWESKTTGAL